MSAELYDTLGGGYTANRGTDPRIAELLWAQLGAAGSVLNVGAGTGSYEPPGRRVVAVEPSATMRAQRPPGAPRCVAAGAEALPFGADSFDAAMTVFSDWFWRDRRAGFAEMRRVARERVLALTFDRSVAEEFWLTREYLPHAHELWGPFEDTLEHFGDCQVVVVPVPGDCSDGFFHAFWRRPHAYLEASIREPMAVFERLDGGEADAGLARLSRDLETGAWEDRHGALYGRDTLDLGYRLLVGTVG